MVLQYLDCLYCCVSLEVHRDTIILQDRSEIPCGLVVWAAGLAPRYHFSYIVLQYDY